MMYIRQHNPTVRVLLHWLLHNISSGPLPQQSYIRYIQTPPRSLEHLYRLFQGNRGTSQCYNNWTVPTRVHLGNVKKIALSQQTCSPLPTNHILRKINQKTYPLPSLKNIMGVYLTICIQPIANEMIVSNNFPMGWQSRVRENEEKWRLVLLLLHHKNPLNKT